ncbi:MAG: ParB N-terminal domain-containing protein [Phenylobacterium sp.]|nr:ParB N-terminal domain-containing protein [Phenylobacterium sp.]
MPSPTLEVAPISQFKRGNRQLRRRKKALIQAHAANITTHGYAPPLLALRSGDLIQGHDHLEAYHLLKRSHVPVIFIDDQPPEQVASMKLWLERFEASGDWDWEAVAAEFKLICEIDPQWLTHTFWETAEIDLALLRGGLGEEPPEEDDDNDLFTGPACAMTGDLLQWDAGHRLLVGNARDGAVVAALMDGRLAQIAALDPPYSTTVSRISS